jgi:hypothetical protein
VTKFPCVRVSRTGEGKNTAETSMQRRTEFTFWPPIDPDNWLERGITIPHDGFHKRVSGETFETLTIAPSVRINGIWHGSITNGEVSTA